MTSASPASGLRLVLFAVALPGCLSAQIPAALQDRLRHKDPGKRLAAVNETSALSPSSGLTANAIAEALATALGDKEFQVRTAAAAALRAPRPPDVAVPALIRALSTAEKDFALARKAFVKAEEPRKTPYEMKSYTAEETDASMYAVGFADAVLKSLATHRNDRAADGVIAAVTRWKADRTPGATLTNACTVLCGYGTKPALEAAAEVLARAHVASESPERALPGPLTLMHTFRAMMRPADSKHVAEMIAALEAAASTAAMTKPAGFDPKAPKAWKALIAAHAKELPARVENAPTASKPATRPR